METEILSERYIHRNVFLQMLVTNGWQVYSYRNKVWRINMSQDGHQVRAFAESLWVSWSDEREVFSNVGPLFMNLINMHDTKRIPDIVLQSRNAVGKTHQKS